MWRGKPQNAKKERKRYVNANEKCCRSGEKDAT